jgi:hypothetical protein
MKITIESTSEVQMICGRPARRWVGTLANGDTCDVYVAGIRLRADADQFGFLVELEETPAPPEFNAQNACDRLIASIASLTDEPRFAELHPQLNQLNRALLELSRELKAEGEIRKGATDGQ